MANVIRSIKRGDVRTFDESYDKGFKSAQASEVDADFDLLYDAWNFGTVNIAAGSVGTDTIADGAVTSAKLAPNSVGSGHIIDGAVAEVDLNPAIALRLAPPYTAADQFKIITIDATGKIVWTTAPPANLVAGQVQTVHLADAPNSVTDAKIASVSWAKVTGAPTTFPPIGAAGGALTGSYPNPSIKPDGITSTEIAAGAVSTSELAAGAVTDAKVTDVGWAKITGVPAAFAPSGAASGDLTGTYPGPSIGPLKVTNAKINDVAWSKVTGAPATYPPSGAAGGALTGSYPNPGVSYGLISGIPGSLPPSGGAGGDLTGSYPSPQVWRAAGDFGVGNDINVTRNVNASAGNGTFNQVQMVGGRYWNGTAYGNQIAFLWTGAAVQMNVDGSSKGTINTTGSDKRLKLNITEGTPGLDAVLALRPITFEYDQAKIAVRGRKYGLIAQEAQAHVPLVVEEDDSNDRYLSIDYRLLVPVLIRAIQELAQKVKA